MQTLREHLIDRGMLPMHEYNIVIDEETYTASFMLFSETGKYLGFQTYKPNGRKTHEGKGMDPRDLKYFTHAVPGEIPMFGVESLDFDNHRVVFLVEGIFDAMKFHSLCLPCLAVLGNNPLQLRSYLKATSSYVVGFCDNDEAGMKLAKLCHAFFIAPEKDAGAMTTDELKHALENQPLYAIRDGVQYVVSDTRHF